jgi:hypothetical protein
MRMRKSRLVLESNHVFSACAPQCQTCNSSFLKYRTGWFMRMRRLSLNPVCASLCTTIPNLSQFFPENSRCFMHTRRLVLESNQVAQFIHHNAKHVRDSFLKTEKIARMRKSRPVLQSNHVAQFVHHKARVLYSAQCTVLK